MCRGLFFILKALNCTAGLSSWVGRPFSQVLKELVGPHQLLNHIQKLSGEGRDVQNGAGTKNGRRGRRKFRLGGWSLPGHCWPGSWGSTHCLPAEKWHLSVHLQVCSSEESTLRLPLCRYRISYEQYQGNTPSKPCHEEVAQAILLTAESRCTAENIITPRQISAVLACWTAPSQLSIAKRCYSLCRS